MSYVRKQFEYAPSAVAWDGILCDLPAKLATRVDFDRVSLRELRSAGRVTLWFRSGARRVFHIRLVRKTGRCLVEVGGIDPAAVLHVVSVCRDHFDEWFGVTAAQK